MGAAVVAIAVVVAALVVVWSFITGISPMPSSRAQVEAVMSLVPSDTTGSIYELGAGWGGLAVALAHRHPRCQVVAYELSPVPYAYLRVRQALRGPTNLRVERRDFLNAPLGEAAVLVSYLYPRAMERLSVALAFRARHGALLITHTFAVRGWEPEQRLELNDLYRTPVYRYRMPTVSEPSAS